MQFLTVTHCIHSTAQKPFLGLLYAHSTYEHGALIDNIMSYTLPVLTVLYPRLLPSVTSHIRVIRHR